MAVARIEAATFLLNLISLMIWATIPFTLFAIKREIQKTNTLQEHANYLAEKRDRESRKSEVLP